MKRSTIFLLVAFILVASGCSQAAPPDVVVQATPVEAAEPTPEPSPTAETLPASLEANRDALKKMGYEIRQGERGWELISPQNQVVLVTSDTLTVQAFGPNNEIIISPEQAFGIAKTNGLGMEQLLTLTDAEGNYTHTFLERAGHWAEVIAPYTNFHELDQCPEVTEESVWSGQLAQSLALHAQPFPEGTLVPDQVEYTMYFGGAGYWVLLTDRISGFSDMSIQYIKEIANRGNYHRRQMSCYRFTPQGAEDEAILGAEQVLMPDGQTYRFEFSGYGSEQPREENIKTSSGSNYNLPDGVFLATVHPPQPGSVSYLRRPIVYSQRYEDGSPLTDSLNGVSLYSLPQNNPLSTRPELEALFQQEASYDTNGARLATVAGDEIKETQYMIFTSQLIRSLSYGNPITENFFGNP